MRVAILAVTVPETIMRSHWRGVARIAPAPKAGGYTLRAATILEDLAGNSLGRPFEVDVFDRVEDRSLNVSESLRFQVE